jgi:hypothetical protein
MYDRVDTSGRLADKAGVRKIATHCTNSGDGLERSTIDKYEVITR